VTIDFINELENKVDGIIVSLQKTRDENKEKEGRIQSLEDENKSLNSELQKLKSGSSNVQGQLNTAGKKIKDLLTKLDNVE
jgi:FtsZ-binding cell division protein ZapB